VSVPPYKVLFLTVYSKFRTLAWYILLAPVTRTSGPIVPPNSGESDHMLCVLNPLSAVGTSCWHRKVSHFVESMKSLLLPQPLTLVFAHRQYIFLYAFFWVIPRRLNFICRRFGTLSVPSS